MVLTEGDYLLKTGGNILLQKKNIRLFMIRISSMKIFLKENMRFLTECMHKNKIVYIVPICDWGSYQTDSQSFVILVFYIIIAKT